MQFLDGATGAPALVLALMAWPGLGAALGLVAAWLTLHQVADPEESLRARPERWGKLGAWAGAALAFVFWLFNEWTSPPYTAVVLWVVLWMIAGGLVMWLRDGRADKITLVVRGILVGVLASGAAYAFAEYPAEALTFLGFAAWGTPLGVFLHVRPGRAQSPEGSPAGTIGFATVVLSTAGLGLVLTGWSWPWLLATLPAAGLLWFLIGLAFAAIAHRVMAGVPSPVSLMPATPHGRDNHGPVVVIMHGFGTTSDEWKGVANLLARNDRDRDGCVVFRLEMPWGVDGQRPKLWELVLPYTSRVLKVVLDRLAKEFPDREIFLLGQSFGAGFGISQAVDMHPRVTGILSLEPIGLEVAGNVLALRNAVFLKWLPGAGRLLTLAIPGIARVFGAEFAPFIDTFRQFRAAAAAVKLGPQTLAELLHEVPKAIDGASRTQAAAVSVLFGAGDTIVAARSARRLTLAGIEHTEIDGGHDLHVTNADAVVEWARGAMDRIRERRALAEALGQESAGAPKLGIRPRGPGKVTTSDQDGQLTPPARPSGEDHAARTERRRRATHSRVPYEVYTGSPDSTLPTLVLERGMLDVLEGWRGVIDRLVRLGHTVVVPDTPWSQPSSPVRRRGRVLSFADLQLDEFVDAVWGLRPAQPIIEVGHSMGATHLLARAGEPDLRVSGVIAICPAGWAWRDRAVGLFGAWPLRAARWVPGLHLAIPWVRGPVNWYLRNRPEDVRQGVGQFMDQLRDPTACAAALRAIPRAIDELSRRKPRRIALPVAVVAFEDDPLVDPRLLRERWAHQKGVIRILEKEGGHTPQVTRPDALAALIHRLAVQLAGTPEITAEVTDTDR